MQALKPHRSTRGRRPGFGRPGLGPQVKRGRYRSRIADTASDCQAVRSNANRAAENPRQQIAAGLVIQLQIRRTLLKYVQNEVMTAVVSFLRWIKVVPRLVVNRNSLRLRIAVVQVVILLRFLE